MPTGLLLHLSKQDLKHDIANSSEPKAFEEPVARWIQVDVRVQLIHFLNSASLVGWRVEWLVELFGAFFVDSLPQSFRKLRHLVLLWSFTRSVISRLS